MAKLFIVFAWAAFAGQALATAGKVTVVAAFQCASGPCDRVASRLPAAPHTLRLVSVDGETVLSHLRWRRWGSPRATARGNYEASNDGGPPRHLTGKTTVILSQRLRLLCPAQPSVGFAYEHIQLLHVPLMVRAFLPLASTPWLESHAC